MKLLILELGLDMSTILIHLSHSMWLYILKIKVTVNRLPDFSETVNPY